MCFGITLASERSLSLAILSLSVSRVLIPQDLPPRTGLERNQLLSRGCNVLPDRGATGTRHASPSEDWLGRPKFRAVIGQKVFFTDYINFYEYDRFDASKLHQFIPVENTKIAGNKFTDKQQCSLWSTPSWLQANVQLRLQAT